MTYKLIIELKNGTEYEYLSNEWIWNFGKNYIILIRKAKPETIRFPITNIEVCKEEPTKNDQPL